MDQWDNEDLTLDERTFLLLWDMHRQISVIRRTLFALLIVSALGVFAAAAFVN